MASVGARLNLYNIIQRRRKTPRPRVFKDRSNPLEELPADEVFRKYRFRPDTILFIVGMFFEDLVHPTLRNSPLPPLLQVLAALRFVATGSFYNLVGESLGVAKSTTGRAARYVCRLLAGKAGNYIKFPRDVSSYKSRFFEIAGKLSLLIFSFVSLRTPWLRGHRSGSSSLRNVYIHFTPNLSLIWKTVMQNFPLQFLSKLVFR